jgi:lysophospholipase L1-like esterase
MEVVIFGDSIAKGVSEPGGGWAGILERDGHDITNFATDGERGGGSLEKIEDFKLTGLGEVVIIATGTNNCGLITNQESGESIEPDPERFVKDFEEVLKLARQKFARTIVLGLMPSDGTIMPLGGEAVVSYDNQTIAEFNDMIKNLCLENEITFVDLLPHFLGHEKELLADHIHPNTEGHEIIVKEVLKALD